MIAPPSLSRVRRIKTPKNDYISWVSFLCMLLCTSGIGNEPAVSSVAKRTLTVREVWASIPGPVKSMQCRQRLATVATFLRSCVAQALSRGDGPRNSLHASA